MRASLKDLQLMTFKILAALSGWKLNFVMTDCSARNLVIKDICAELETESLHDSLICNVHPMKMFKKKIKLVWQERHDALGTNTIKDCFITNVDL